MLKKIKINNILVDSIKISNNGKFLVLWDWIYAKHIILYDIEKDNVFYTTYEFNYRTEYLDISPNSNFIAFDVIENESLCYVIIYDTTKKEIIKKINSTCFGLNFSNDTSYLSLIDSNNIIHIYETSSFEKINEINLSSKNVAQGQLLFIKQNNYLIYCHEKGNVNIIDINTSKIISELNHKAVRVAIDTSSNCLATIDTDENDIKIWDIENLKLIKTIPSDIKNDFTRNLLFSPDGLYIISSSTSGIQIFDINMNKLVRHLDSWTNSTTFSSDGKYLIYSDDNETISFHDFYSLINS